LSEARDQSDVLQAGREEPVRARFRIGVGPLDRRNDHSFVMLFGWSLEKNISPSIDEEADISRIGHPPSTPDASGLINGLAEFSIRRKTVLQVAADGPRVDRQAMLSPTTSGASP
jgi:hypothetical protein